MAPLEDRPVDATPVHTEDLPATPQRDRAIPATAWIEAPAELLALAADDLATRFTFRLYASGDGEGLGPDGVVHHRFRTWKESLRDAAPTWREGGVARE